MRSAEGLVVDWEGLAENFDHDKIAIAMIVEAFLETIHISLERIRTAIHSADGRKIALAAHNLKGAISNFGAQNAVKLAQRLENIGNGEVSDDASRIFDRLQNEVKIIVDELNSESGRYKR